MDCCYQTFGFYIFWLLVILVVYRLISFIFITFIAPVFGVGHKWKIADNYWAVVTGSTDGIGLEYAKQLGQKGYNLLLISRSDEKLKNTAELMKEKCKGKCKNIRTLRIDFSKMDIYEKISEELSKIDHIEVLVNNVGISYDYPEYFHKIPNRTELVQNLINVNITSTSRMMDLILPRMVTQGSGVIINIASLSALCPSPLLAVYAATKTYVDYLTRALQLEYKNKGLTIQSVLPGLVCSNMSKVKKSSMMAPLASTFVRSALATVGLENKTYGYWGHKLQGNLGESISRWFGDDSASKLFMNNLEGFRIRYYKKNGLKQD